MDSWRKEEAERVLADKLTRIEVSGVDIGGHTAVMLLCGNDDIALGSLSALQGGSVQKITQRVLIIGFDGVPEFSDKLRTAASSEGSPLLWLATAKVQIDKLVERAAMVVQEIRNHPSPSAINPESKVVASILSSDDPHLELYIEERC